MNTVSSTSTGVLEATPDIKLNNVTGDISVTLSEDSNFAETTIALVALIAALAAFIIAFLQATLQYLTSNQRDKCLHGAIGDWSRFTKTRWDFRTWRIKVTYPRLNVGSLNSLLEERQTDLRILRKWAYYSMDTNHTGPIRIVSRRYFDASTTDFFFDFWELCSGTASIETVGQKPRAVKFWDLTFRSKLSWVKFIVLRRRRRSLSLARAGWANMMLSLDIRPMSVFFSNPLFPRHGDLRRLASGELAADFIPSGVDVAPQKMSISVLAELCYCFGLRDIQVNVLKGTIHGQSHRLKVFTITVPGLGQVVSLDGDFTHIWRENSILSRAALEQPALWAGGDFGVDIEFVYIPGVLQSLLKNCCLQYKGFEGRVDERPLWRRYILDRVLSRGVKEYRSFIRKVSPREQSSYYENHFTMSGQSWGDFWVKSIEAQTPTLISILPVLEVPTRWCSTPNKLFLTPFLPHIYQAMQGSWETQGKSGMPMLSASSTIEQQIFACSVDFVNFDKYSRTLAGKTLLNLDDATFPKTVDIEEDDGAGIIGQRGWLTSPTVWTVSSWNESISSSAIWDFDHFKLPSYVLELLSGTPMKKIKDLDRFDSLYRENGATVLEQSVFFSIALIECRLHGLWRKAFISDEPDPEVLRRFPGWETDVWSTSQEDGSWMKSSNRGFLAGFLALWFEICRQEDAIGPTDRLLVAMDDVLARWGNDDAVIVDIQTSLDLNPNQQQFDSNSNSGIPTFLSNASTLSPNNSKSQGNSKVYTTALVSSGGGADEKGYYVEIDGGTEKKPTTGSAGYDYRKFLEWIKPGEEVYDRPMSKREFCAWVDERIGRKRYLQLMLPIFQLRIFLMIFMFECMEDSTEYALAKEMSAVVVTLI